MMGRYDEGLPKIPFMQVDKARTFYWWSDAIARISSFSTPLRSPN